MTREAFYQEMKAGVIRRCYLMEGEEEYTKLAAVRTLREAVLRGPFGALNESVLHNPGANDLIACAETLPFLGDKRLVLVRDSGWFGGKSTKDDEDAGERPAKDGGADAVSRYLENLPETLCLVFLVKGKANGTRKLYKQLVKQGAHVAFDALQGPLLRKWITQELRRDGKVIQPDVADQLVFAVGSDMHLLYHELRKLAAWVGEGTEVSVQAIDAVCTKSAEYRVFDLSDALSTGQAGRTTQLMDEMIRQGEQRLMLLALLERQYRQLLFTRLLSDARRPPEAIARSLGVAPFVVRKLQTNASRHTVSQLKAAYDLLVDTEFAVKSGQINQEGALEQAVYRVLAMREGAKA